MLYSLIILCFANCGGRSRKANDKSVQTHEAYVDIVYPIEIDVRKKYDREALNIEDIADVEYIPLETGKDILLSNVLNGLSVSDSLLITINHPPLHSAEAQKRPLSPYCLMSKQDGTLQQLDFKVPEILDGRIRVAKKTDSGNSRTRTVGFNTSPVIRNGEEFFISDFACDTIYSFINGIKGSYIVNKPSVQGASPPLFVGISLKTTRYTFLSIVETIEETMTVDRKVIAIDHKTGKIFEPDIKGFPFGLIPENYFKTLPAEYSAMSLSALSLTGSLEKGELGGELKEVASRLKEDDNPVVMLLKFKK